MPIGLAVLAQALPQPAWELGGLELKHYLLIAAVCGYSIIGSFYARRFGKVEELPYPGASVGLQMILVLVILALAITADVVAEPPVFVSGLLIAFWIAVIVWPARSVRAQYLGIAILLMLVSLLPVTGISRERVGLIYGLVFGSALVISGIVDHVLFTRLLREPAHD